MDQIEIALGLFEEDVCNYCDSKTYEITSKILNRFFASGYRDVINEMLQYCVMNIYYYGEPNNGIISVNVKVVDEYYRSYIFDLNLYDSNNDILKYRIYNVSREPTVDNLVRYIIEISSDSDFRHRYNNPIDDISNQMSSLKI